MKIDPLIFATTIKIGVYVRDERRRLGLDQRTLAREANVAVRSVYRVEYGAMTVRLEVVVKILAALGMDLEVIQRRGCDATGAT